MEKEPEKSSKKSSPGKNSEGHESEKSERLTRLPIARIRTLVKADQDISLATQGSIFLITKCTELFIEYLAKETHKKTVASKRKTMQKADLDSVIDVMDEFSFLEGILDT
jgi:DNA polymerase epsilon subunit 4